MRAAKVVGLGILFSFAGFMILLVISLKHSMAGSETAHATALSAIVGGLLNALLSPITLLVIVIGFATAIWMTRKTSKPNPTS